MPLHNGTGNSLLTTDKVANDRSMTSDNLMTRKEKMEELGWSCTIVKKLGKNDSIENGRILLQSAYFDEDGCSDGIRALSNYTKEFDEKANRYKDKPRHDWASDWADSFQYLGTAIQAFESVGRSIHRKSLCKSL